MPMILIRRHLVGQKAASTILIYVANPENLNIYTNVPMHIYVHLYTYMHIQKTQYSDMWVCVISIEQII